MSWFTVIGDVTRRDVHWGAMVRTVRTVVALVATVVSLASCGSSLAKSDDDAPVATTSLVSTTTSTMPVLPTPEPVPDENAPDPNIRLGRVLIPAIDVDTPLFQGITLKTFARGAGWWPGTAMPGEWGNSVIAAHRVTPPKPFRHLEKLKPGDEVIFEISTGRFVYIVTATKIVDNSAMWIVDQTPAFTVTLFACHPVGSTAQRIVVFATLRNDNTRT